MCATSFCIDHNRIFLSMWRFVSIWVIYWKVSSLQACGDFYACFILEDNDAQSHSGELDVKFQLAKDIWETMLSSKYSIRDQLSNMVSVILDFCFFNPKYFSKCKCSCLNMFYHLPFRMRPQTGLYPKKPMRCSLWHA